MGSDVEQFSGVYGPSVCPPQRSVQIFCTFFNEIVCLLVWSHVSSLYILEIKPLSEVSLENMFSHTFGSLYILLMFSLSMQKLFVFMKSHLFILYFISLALGDVSVKILLCGIPESFLSMFSSGIFMVS